MKKYIKQLLEIYKKYEEVLNYLIFGGLTTLVSIASYALFAKVFGIYYLVSTVIAWIISVTFALITNKIFVFKSKTISVKGTAIEGLKFYSSRLFTLGLEMVFKKIFVDVLFIDDLIATVIIQVFIIVLNYVLSKLVVFKKKSV